MMKGWPGCYRGQRCRSDARSTPPDAANITMSRQGSTILDFLIWLQYESLFYEFSEENFRSWRDHESGYQFSLRSNHQFIHRLHTDLQLTCLSKKIMNPIFLNLLISVVPGEWAGGCVQPGPALAQAEIVMGSPNYPKISCIRVSLEILLLSLDTEWRVPWPSWGRRGPESPGTRTTPASVWPGSWRTSARKVNKSLKKSNPNWGPRIWHLTRP